MTPQITQHDPDIWTVQNLLTPDECAALIQKGETLGFNPASVRMRSGLSMRVSGVRNNDRAEWTDDVYARELWERVKGLVPGEIAGCAARGLYDNFRFYRYDVGQRFKMHRDGSVVSADGMQKSRLSFLLYLNDDYEGGETVFSEASAAEPAENAAPPVVIKPQTGMGLFFMHERRHEGSPVTVGRKYLVRTDVFFDVLLKANDDI